MVMLKDSEYTIDATAKTITLASPYHALSLSQIGLIYNLTTGSVIHDIDRTDGGISLSSDVITYIYDDVSMSDTDELAINVDLNIYSHDGHLKTYGINEAVGDLVTNSSIVVERANGKKTGIGGGAFTILETHPFDQPTGNTQMYAQSTSADDAAAGSGAEEITIEYFSFVPFWGARKTVKFVPTGLAQVVLSVSDIYRVHKVYTNKGSVAAGDITITNISETELYGQIDTNNTFMERSIFYVAEGESVTCTEIIVSSVTAGGIEIRLAASEEDSSGNVVTRGRVPIETNGTSFAVPLIVSETVTNPNNLRIAILLAVRAAGAQSNQSGTGHMRGRREPISNGA